MSTIEASNFFAISIAVLSDASAALLKSVGTRILLTRHMIEAPSSASVSSKEHATSRRVAVDSRGDTRARFAARVQRLRQARGGALVACGNESVNVVPAPGAVCTFTEPP